MAKDICTTINYRQEDGTRPFAYVRERTPDDAHKKDYGGSHASVEVLVKDGRSQQLSLDIHSFQLVKQETKLSTDDFYTSPEKIKKDYYEEIAELFKKTTGAEEVIVFHHQVRNAEKNNGNMKNIHTSIQGYAYGIHSDSHPASAQDLFKGMASKLDKKYHTGRFLYINAWRNISETPIGNNHLAVCDETSLVSPDDYITSDLFGPGYNIQQYGLLDRNSAQHRWYYFSNMKKDEVLLFKQWDSDTSLSGRITFHTAITDPNAPKDTPVRESIEVRGICFFPEHEPNTCPIMVEEKVDAGENADEKRAREAVKKIFSSFDNISYFPESAKSWVKITPVKQIIQDLVTDSENHFNLKSANAKTKARASELLEEGKFDEKIKMARAKLNNKNNQFSISFSNVLPVAAGCAIGWTMGYLYYQQGGKDRIKKITKSLR